jgi:hypothetical protein
MAAVSIVDRSLRSVDGKLFDRSTSPPAHLTPAAGTSACALCGSLRKDSYSKLGVGAVRPTQVKTLAVMEVSGGSQSINRGWPARFRQPFLRPRPNTTQPSQT